MNAKEGVPPPHPSCSGTKQSRSFRSICNVCLYIYISLRRYISIIWIKLNRYIDQPDRSLVPQNYSESKAPSYHKVLLIGDGLAFGLGDTRVVIGTTAGVTPHLSQSATNDNKIRRSWKIINRGDANTTSASWLPTKGEKEKESGTHYDALFQEIDGIGKDAEIVVLMMGISDVLVGSKMEDTSIIMPRAAEKRDPLKDLPYPNSEVSTVVQNISKIAKALQVQGKKVCIVDIPTTIPGIPNIKRGLLRRLNQQLKQVVNVLNNNLSLAATNKARISKIQYFSLGNNHAVQRREYRSFDSIYLNRTGYKKLALDLYGETLRSMMISVEWNVWKSALGDENIIQNNSHKRNDKEE